MHVAHPAIIEPCTFYRSNILNVTTPSLRAVPSHTTAVKSSTPLSPHPHPCRLLPHCQLSALDPPHYALALSNATPPLPFVQPSLAPTHAFHATKTTKSIATHPHSLSHPNQNTKSHQQQSTQAYLPSIPSNTTNRRKTASFMPNTKLIIQEPATQMRLMVYQQIR